MNIITEYINGNWRKRLPLRIKNVGDTPLVVRRIYIINQNSIVYNNSMQGIFGFPFSIPSNYHNYSLTSGIGNTYGFDIPYNYIMNEFPPQDNFKMEKQFWLNQGSPSTTYFSFSVVFDPTTTLNLYSAHLVIHYANGSTTTEAFNELEYCADFHGTSQFEGEMDKTDLLNVNEIDRTGIFNIIELKA